MTDPTLRQWGAHIKAHRLARGLTQSRLAELVGVSQGTVSHWEAGHDEPGRVNKAKLAHLLDTHVGVLFPHPVEDVA